MRILAEFKNYGSTDLRCIELKPNLHPKILSGICRLFHLEVILLLVVMLIGFNPSVNATCADTIYTVTPFGSYAPIPGTGSQIFLSDDDVSGSLPIGFTFTFFGNDYTTFYISSNGFITFNNDFNDGCCSGDFLPSSGTPNNLIAFAWGDLDPSSGGTVSFFTGGTAPNRFLVVNFDQVPHCCSPGNAPVTSQTVLYETSNEIEIHTTSQPEPFDDHTMGIENSDGSIGYAAPGRNSTPWTTSFDYMRFIPQGCGPNPNDAGVLNINGGGLACPGTQNVTATIANFGDNIINNVTLNWEFDGIAQTPVSWNTPLDTPGGSGSTTATVTLGSKAFTQGVNYEIKAWTSSPNGVADTVNTNDTAISSGAPGLAGTFTIGGSNPDYATINAAVNDLKNTGVCGPVVYNIRPGTYIEQISIPYIFGTSATNTITFQSETLDTGDVTIRYNSLWFDSNYVVQFFFGASDIIFQHVTVEALGTSYGRGFVIKDGCENIQIRNNRVVCVPVPFDNWNIAPIFAYDINQAHDITIVGNHTLNGSHGIYLEGNGFFGGPDGGGGGGPSFFGTIIEDNTIENTFYYGVFLYFHEGPVVNSNVIVGDTNSYSCTGIYAYYCDGDLRFTKNDINILSYGTGIFLEYNMSFSGNEGLIANNFIYVTGSGGGGPIAGSQGGGGGLAGIYMWDNEYQQVYHNSVNMASSDAFGQAFYYDFNFEVAVLNNIFANTGGGYSVYAFSDPDEMDYNDLYSTGQFLAYDGSSNLVDLAAWQAATNLDSNSISVDPFFFSNADLHVSQVLLNAVAVPLAAVPDDIDGETRNATNPDIGADEFNPPPEDAGIAEIVTPSAPLMEGVQDIEVRLRNFGLNDLTSVTIQWEFNDTMQSDFSFTGSIPTAKDSVVVLGSYDFMPGQPYSMKAWTSLPNGMADPNPGNDTSEVNGIFTAMSGVYTIGGTSPDYTTFSAAVADLILKGVAGPVTFNVRDGVYNEQVIIPSIFGASASRPITFTSESQDSTAAVISFSSSFSNDYLVRFDAASYVTFDRIGFSPTNFSYSRCVELLNGSSNIRLTNNSFNGLNTSSSTTFRAVIYIVGDNTSSVLIDGNALYNGSYGIYFLANFNNYGEGNVITNNRFINQYYRGLYATYHNDIVVSKNLFETNSFNSTFRSIYLQDCDGNSQVTKNTIYQPNGGYGIFQSSNVGTFSAPGLVANNFISIGGTGTAYGIYHSSCSYQDVVFNNVHITSTNTGAGIGAYYAFSNNMFNKNNVLANSGGGYAIYSNSNSFSASDKNDYFTTGPVLSYFNTDLNTLTDWQSATGLDSNSFSVDPGYASASDLHVSYILLNGTADPFPGITDDIDGEIRDSLNPDIGADEFVPIPNDISPSQLLSPMLPFIAGSTNVEVEIINNGGNIIDSATIQWEINGVQQPDVMFAGPLSSGAVSAVNLGSFNFLTGTAYTIKIWTGNPNGVADNEPVNDTIVIDNIYAALIDTYTIGGIAPDFANPSEAVNALNFGGILGNVTFLMRDGSYQEQVVINEYSGASDTSGVLFTSESGDSTAVSWSFNANSSANYTIQINGADYLTFEKLTLLSQNSTYGRVIDMRNGSHNNCFKSNRFIGSVSTSTSSSRVIFYSDADNDTSTQFINNHFSLGSYGIYMRGNSFLPYESGTVIRNNTFVDQTNYGVYLYYQSHPAVMSNNMTARSNSSTSYRGILSIVVRNGAEFSKNKIVLPNGGYGIYMDSHDGTSNENSIIANNFISVSGNSTAYGIYTAYGDYNDFVYNNINITNTSTNSRGIYSFSGFDNDFFNNNIVNTGGGVGFYTSNTFGVDSLDHNNYYVTGPSFGYFNTDILTFASWQSTTGKDANSVSIDPGYVSFEDLHVSNALLEGNALPRSNVSDDIDGEARNATNPDIGADEFTPAPLDAALVSIDSPSTPMIAGVQNVYVTLLNNGTITLDSVQINWEVNGVLQTQYNWSGSLGTGMAESVNIGFFNFSGTMPFNIRAWTTSPNGQFDPVPLNDTTISQDLYVGLIGEYIIGGLNADFVNFTEAANALNSNGIVGPVSFRVTDGIYNEAITLNEITGASGTNTITFFSDSEDSTSVTISGGGFSSTNWVVQMLGTDHVTFRDMTLATAGSTYGRVLILQEEAHNNTFENVVFQGSLVQSTSTIRAVVYSSGWNDTANVFRNCVFRNGDYGVYYIGTNTSNLEPGTVFENNKFIDQSYRSTLIQNQDGTIFTGNTFTTQTTFNSYIGIWFSYVDNMVVTKNKVAVPNGQYAGYFINCDAGFGGSERGLIANNFFQVGGTTTAYGMYLNSCVNQDVFHNNVHVNGTNTSLGRAIYITGGSNNVVRSNIFHNSGGGYAYYVSSGFNLNASDYNDLFSSGTNLGYWAGSTATNLADWQTNSGQDANSISIDPGYASATDLHVSQINLDGATVPTSRVTDDIDGQARNATNPDIGADEFGAGLIENDVGIIAIVSPVSDCDLGVESVTVRIQNFGVDTLSGFDVTYVVDDTILVTENVDSLQIIGGLSVDFTFATTIDLSDFNIYNFKVYTSLAGDTINENDTIVKNIQHYPFVTPTVSDDKVICQGNYVFLTASGGTSYVWRYINSNFVLSYSSSVYVNPGQTTTYVVTVTNAFGCSAKDTVTVNVLPAPPTPVITANGSFSICGTDTIMLQSSIGTNIVWNTGDTTQSILINNPGWYYVTHTDSINGCTSQGSIYLSGNTAPYISPGFTQICDGNTVTLSVIGSATSYLWNTGATSQSIVVSPSVTTQYSCVINYGINCQVTRFSTVSVLPDIGPATITSISPDDTICSGENSLLTVAGNALQYQWSTGNFGSTINVAPLTTTTYSVTASNNICSPGTATASVTVFVKQTPTTPIIVATGTNYLSFCDADSILLSSSNFPDSIIWNTGATTQSIWVFNSGNYSVTHVSPNGCSATAAVNISDPPNAYITGITNICEGQSTTLTVQNGDIYQWSTGATTASITVTPDSTTTYDVTVTNIEGCEYDLSVTVNVLPDPVITSVSADATLVCPGTPVVLTATGSSLFYSWSTGQTSAAVTVYPSDTTTYSVTAQNGNQCGTFDFATITVYTHPAPDTPEILVTGDSIICSSDSVLLTSDIVNNIEWSTGETTASIYVTSSGNYTVTHTENVNGCTSTSEAAVVNVFPDATIVSNILPTVCQGDSITLTVINANAYTWSTGATTQSITVAPNDTATYGVVASNAAGCMYEDSITVNVLQPVPPSAPGNLIPVDGIQNIFTPIQFSWAPAFNASAYDLYIWLDSLPQPGSPTVANITQISYLYNGGLFLGQDYKWTVVAKNSCFETAGPVHTFGTKFLPDLVVDNITVPVNAFSGQKMNLTFEVTNQGIGNTGMSTWFDAIYLSLDSVLEIGIDHYLGAVQNFSFLDSNETYSQNALVTIPNGLSGFHYVFVVTDRFNGLAETDNNNNTNISTSQVLVNLTPPPDLRVQTGSIIVSGATPLPPSGTSGASVPINVFSGTSATITWTVENNGTGPTVESIWNDRVYLSQDLILNTGTAFNLGTFQHNGILEEDSTYTLSGVVNIPPSIFGTYYLYIHTDVNNQVYEQAAENNNVTRSDSITVILTPPPDLQVTSIAAPTSASNKQSINVSWTVENLGGSSTLTSFWQDRIYFSDQPVFDPMDAMLLATQSHSGALNLGDSYSKSRNVVVPNVSGTHYIYVETDFSNKVDEFMNENNNVARSDSIDVLNPDLVVASVTVPGSDSSGTPVLIQWEIANIGTGQINATNWRDRIYLSTLPVFHPDSVTYVGDLFYGANLLAGDTLARQKSIVLPNGIQGNYFVFIQTDQGNHVFEAMAEGNNISGSATPINVALSPWADLQVVNITTPDTTTAGFVTAINFTVRNDGGAVTNSFNWTDRIYWSSKPTWDPDSAYAMSSVPRSDFLKVDSIYTVYTSYTLPGVLPADFYYIYVVTDVTNAVFEHTDEGNNVLRSDPVLVNPYPPIDIAVTSAMAPNMGNSGQSITVDFTVENVGAAPTLKSSWTDRIYLSADTIFDPLTDQFLANVNHGGKLNPGASYSRTKSVMIPNGISGNYCILVVADFNNTNNDADYTNNVMSITDTNGVKTPIVVALTPPSDLEVTSFSAPVNGTSGQPIEVIWTVSNNGVGPTTAGGWVDRIYLSTDFVVGSGDIVLGSVARNSNLNAGASYTDTASFTIPINVQGNYIVLIKTDNNNAQYEHLAEGNNVASSIISIVLPPPSDLFISGISAPLTAIAGEPVTISWTVENIGFNPAKGNMTEGVYFSTDAVWDISDVLFDTKQTNINIAPANNVVHTLTMDLTGVPLGDYYVIVRTDILNNINESNNSNNTGVSGSLVNVNVKQLILNMVTPDILDNQEELYYRIEIPDSLEDESLLIQLKGDSINGGNEFYVRYGNIPTRVIYDYSHDSPFEGNQEIVVPTLQQGTYYIMAYGNTTAGPSQAVTLFARILEFEIRSVDADQGGNTGQVTLEIKGSKFEPDMTMSLKSGGTVIPMTGLTYVDPTVVFASFDLTGRPLGDYDVLAEKLTGDTTSLVDGFTIIPGSPPDLQVNVIYPSSTRPGNVVTMYVEFFNAGNVDIISPVLKLKSPNFNPIAFTVPDLANGFVQLDLELQEPNGPAGILRPGVNGSIIVYGKASSFLTYTLKIPDFN